MPVRHMRQLVPFVALALGMAALAGCRKEAEAPSPLMGSPSGVQLNIPPAVLDALGAPVLPADNPLTIEGIALGRKLFHEKALSIDLSMSCASCHQQANSFADPLPFSVGTDGSTGTRSAMPLANLAWATQFFWDGRAEGLEAQAHDPVVNPVEMHNTWTLVEERLNADGIYRQMFHDAFGTQAIDSTLVVKAIAQFERSLLSFNSPFDRFYYGSDATAMSEEAQNGFTLFKSQGKCAGCHTVGLFTDNAFRNNGLDLAPADPGLGAISGNPADLGKFKVPSLRNVAVTAPYMHDSRFASLEEVLGHYNGGVLMASPNVDGHMDFWGMNPTPFSADEINDLLAFLQALTDSTFLNNPAYGQP